eukprot:CAMPEP_0115386354 /NCGR_PEP_ID=MMETSP0271-20121206/8097_1 /TAXON_ID=71861 /ORGANISM="Scrippsiella trochoidea, Strain CCMP3099" /LENGTH=601 /DNA_ID=CAMNT_0002809771 /DNA_START=71 /DNA_END=1877 /DNA_ORIENTATION=+
MIDANRWLARHLSTEAPCLTVGVGALVVASFVNFRTGEQLKAAIDRIPVEIAQLLRRSALLFGLGAVASCIRTYIFDSTAERLRAALAAEVFAARLRIEPSTSSPNRSDDDLAFKSNSIAPEDALATTHTTGAMDESDVALCADLVLKLQNVARYTSSVVGGTVAMSIASWKLTAAVWPLLVTGALRGVRAGTKRAGKAAQQLADAREEALGFAEERLQHQDLVRWFSRAEPEAVQFRRRCDACVTLASKAARGRGIAHMVVDMASKGVLLGLCSLGSHLVKRGELTAGELISFFFHASFLGLGLYGLVGLAPEIAVAHVAAGRLVDVLTKAEGTMPPNSSLGPAAPVPITFEDVHFDHPMVRKSVLEGFSLEVPAGRTCALVGTSGSGKSTALALLLRDFDPRRGRILLDGQDIRHIAREQLRERIGIAPQSSALLGASVHEAIAFGSTMTSGNVDADDVERAAKMACAHGFITARPGAYMSPVGRGGSLLSGGERQRLSLARALARNAPVLLLDEPTSALDATTAADLAEAVLAPRPKRPTTLVVTHSLALIRRCEQVAVISSHGCVVQCGTFAALAAETDGPLAQIIKAGELVDDAPR